MDSNRSVGFGVVVGVVVVLLLLGATTVPLMFGPMMMELNEEIAPNETAFLVPLEEKANEGGAKFGSIEDLEQSVVRAQRVLIPQRKQSTGRMPGSFRWIPTMRVLKVDRSQVTREWTKDTKTGTAAKDQAIAVESLDSINFKAGAAIGCSIVQEDSAKFLYYFAGKPLSEVVDTNVRGFCQSVLSREFGKALLSQCPGKKAEAFKLCFDEAKTFYKAKGITIDYLGSSEGLSFDNPEMQKQFDRQFIAENEIKIASQEKLAQDEKNATMLAKKKAEAEALIEAAKQERLAQEERNATMLAKKKAEAEADIQAATLERQAQEERNANIVSKAKAEREAAEEVAKGAEGLKVRTDMEVKKLQAEAVVEFAKNWKGAFPAYLPSNATFFLGMDQFMPHPVVAAQPAK